MPSKLITYNAELVMRVSKSGPLTTVSGFIGKRFETFKEAAANAAEHQRNLRKHARKFKDFEVHVCKREETLLHRRTGKPIW